MTDDVGAPGDGLAEKGRRQRVVDDERNPRLMRDLGDRLQIDHHAAGIGEALDENRLGPGRQRLAEIVGVGRIDEMAGPAELS